MFCGTAAAGNRSETHAPVYRGAFVTPQDFDYLRKFLRERSGLVLAVEKQYLAESRLLPVVRRNGMNTLAELIDRLKNRAPASLSAQVVEAMTTNETFFFRDKIPFDHFRDTVMPALILARAREKRIRIWCTAASTGQEPYSLAMAIKSMGPAVAGYRIDIVATDLSSDVLEKAKVGIYSQFEVQRGLPVQLLVKFFDQVGETWQVAPELRSMVQFRSLNLLNDFSVLGNFDLVFCRNVLIYFDQEIKVAVLNRIARQMPEDGFLVLGAAETVIGLTEAFKPLTDKRGLYVPNGTSQSRNADNVIRFAAAKA
jgi:chemotaxis protein methyltransferase CheR